MMQAVTFSSNGHYLNLSRVDPATISIGVGSSNYFHAVGGSAPYVFISLILVNTCYLEEPRTSTAGKTQKLIEGACIEGEWERLVGCIGQIIHAREFKGQVQGGNLSFTTAFASSGGSEFYVLSYVYRWIAITSHTFLSASSPSTSTLGRRVGSASSFSRGPGGHSGSGVLGCYDVGRFISVIYLICLWADDAIEFLYMMQEPKATS